MCRADLRNKITPQVTIINFTVTMTGLEDQLLVDVVKNERPDLETKKDELVRFHREYPHAKACWRALHDSVYMDGEMSEKKQTLFASNNGAEINPNVVATTANVSVTTSSLHTMKQPIPGTPSKCFAGGEHRQRSTYLDGHREQNLVHARQCLGNHLG